MFKPVFLAVCLATGLAAPSAALAEPINLVCKGVGDWPAVESTFESAQVFSGDKSAYGSGGTTTTRRARGDVQMRIEFTDETSGRIKYPREMIPPLHGGARDGWWPFTRVEMSEDQIHAQFSMNILNKPKLVIDRHTGDMDLKMYQGGFTGTCERAPDAPEERKF